MRDILKKLDQYKYISFDIFDTLIYRNVRKPSDIFMLVSKKYYEVNAIFIEDFPENRQKVEHELRCMSKNEITYNEIYEKISEIYGIDAAEKLKKIEIEIEIKYCTVNRELLALYKFCIQRQKQIILITDMYLPKDTIKLILHKCGIENYYKLFVSSEAGKRKADGAIFDLVIHELNISRTELIHLGDNKKSDYLEPLKKGIKAIRIKNHSHLNYYNKKCKSDTYRQLSVILNNYVDVEKSYYWNFGLELLSPLLLGFSQWLLNEVKTNHINKLYFLSRDGACLKRVFDELNISRIETHYLYASRRALIVPTLWKDVSLKNIMNSFFWGKRFSIKEFFIKVGLDCNLFMDILYTSGYTSEDVVDTNNILYNKKFYNLYEKLEKAIVMNSKIEYDVLVNYLEQEGVFSDKIAIVDIGWFGNMQQALNIIVKDKNINNHINGYYVGLWGKKGCGLKSTMKGFLFEPGYNQSLRDTEHCFNAIFEILFSTSHGSVRRFKTVNNTVVPVFEEYEYINEDGKFRPEKNIIEEIQNGAFEGVKQLYQYRESFGEVTPYVAFCSMTQFGTKPRKQDLHIWENFRTYDGVYREMVQVKSVIYYLLHPIQLKKDFINSRWRIGFINHFFHLKNLSFFLYKFLIKINNIKKNTKSLIR